MKRKNFELKFKKKIILEFLNFLKNLEILKYFEIFVILKFFEIFEVLKFV
jgi:hypothetical protein